MDRKSLGINFNLQFQDIQNLNPSFDLARVGIAYHGLNRNHSIISKEVFEKALPSLYNVPIVGRYIPDEGDFGSHDIMVAVNENGEYSIENATVPFGVVPESSKFTWETVQEENGEEREYLFANCVIWKRSYGYETLISQKEWSQSMEITVNDFEYDEDQNMVIKDMTFTALCILGNNIEPCFESASVQLDKNYEMSNFSTQFSLMLDDFKKLTKQAIAYELTGSVDDKSEEEGGNCALEKTEEMFEATETEETSTAEENFEDAEVNNAEPETSADEPAEAPEEVPAEEPGEEPAEEQPEENAEPEGEATFTLMYKEKFEALIGALEGKTECVEDENGRCVSHTEYWLCDFDDNFAYVEKYHWSFDEGESRTKGRFAYVDSDEGVALGEYNDMVVAWLTPEEYAQVEADREELSALRDYKSGREDADHRAEIDQVVSGEFADVVKTEEFEALASTIYGLGVDEVREKLFAIRGKHAVSKSKDESYQNSRIPVAASSSKKSNTKYGNLFEVYGKSK